MGLLGDFAEGFVIMVDRSIERISLDYGLLLFGWEQSQAGLSIYLNNSITRSKDLTESSTRKAYIVSLLRFTMENNHGFKHGLPYFEAEADLASEKQGSLTGRHR